MTAILRNLPFFEREDEVAVGAERVRIRPYQIIVWVSLSAKAHLELPPHALRFPAILDTGNNHNFSIGGAHVRHWTGVDLGQISVRGAIREGSRRPELYSCNVWLHANQPGLRDRFAPSPPCCLELPEGVAVYPEADDYPPLPLLGLRA